MATSKFTLKDKASVIAGSYLACVLIQRLEIPGVLVALSGSLELANAKRQYQQPFITKCQAMLVPFACPQGVSLASLWAKLGAAEALSQAAVAGEPSEEQAQDELMETILAMVRPSK